MNNLIYLVVLKASTVFKSPKWRLQIVFHLYSFLFVCWFDLLLQFWCECRIVRFRKLLSWSQHPLIQRCGRRGFSSSSDVVFWILHWVSIQLQCSVSTWTVDSRVEKYRKALIWGTVRARVVLEMEDPNTFCAGSGVLHQFNHRCWEPWETFVQPISLSLSSSFLHPAAFVLPIPLSPIKAELNLLRGPNRCVLFLQQFEMITQLWCLSVTSCDDRHCNRAGEIVFFHSSTPPPPPDSLPFSLAAAATTATVIPLPVSFSSWRDGGACAS